MYDAYADLNIRLGGVSPATLAHRLERSGLRYFGYASCTSRRICYSPYPGKDTLNYLWFANFPYQRYAGA